MRKKLRMVVALTAVLLFSAVTTAAQKFKEVYTGTIYAMNVGRGATTGFNLSISGYTSDEDAKRYLAILAEGNQEDLLKQIRDLELGRLSATGHVGRNLIVVRKAQLDDGKTRIVAVFERWQTIREIRSGSRIQDYPFGIMEIIVDAKGKGSGTFISACKVDLKRDKKTGQYSLELENFGTYPNKVMGVMLRK